MKKIIISAATFMFAVATFAQKSEVISDSLSSKSKLYSKSLLWIATTWKNANNVIQLKDEEAGTIIVKGGLSAKPKSMGIPGDGLTTSTITIRVKDGKVKISFENTKFDYSNGSSTLTMDMSKSGKWYISWQQEVLAEETAMIENYKNSLLTKSNDDF